MSPVRVAFLLVTAVGVFGSCRPADVVDPDASTFQEISGSWTYRADGLDGDGLSCAVSDMTMTIAKIPGAGAFSGSTEGGQMRCLGGSEPYEIELPSHPVREGYTFNEYVSFNVYNAGWRSNGTVSGDTMQGLVKLESGGRRLQGRFMALRVATP